jgi:hypothetical protein
MVSIERPGLFFAGLVQPIGPTIPLVEVQRNGSRRFSQANFNSPSRR